MILFAFIAFFPLFYAQIYVNPNSTCSPCNGSKDLPYPDIPSALNSKNGSIILMDGVYYVNNIIIANRTLAIQSLNGPNSSFIDGQYNSSCLSLINGTFLINGITIRNCIKSPTTTSLQNIDKSNSGAAIWIENASTTLYSVIIINSYAGGAGGGVGLSFGSFFLYKCEIRNNTANFGGGVYINQASGSFSITEIKENQAKIQGGGIFEKYSEIDFQISSIIQGNFLSLNETKNQIACLNANATFEIRVVYDGGFYCEECQIFDRSKNVDLCNTTDDNQGNSGSILVNFYYLGLLVFIMVGVVAL